MSRLLVGRPAARLLRLFLFAVLLAVPVILLVLNQRREVIATSVWYIIWFASRVSKSVPQHTYWILFLLTALVITIASLVRRGRRAADEAAMDLERMGRVHRLAVMVRKAESSPYMRWQLARLLSGLALEKLDGRERGPASGELGRLSGDQKAPSPEVLAYLEAGLGRWPHEDSGLRWRIGRLFRTNAPMGALDLDPHRVVLFLEDQGTRLEVFDDR